jgi:hypothetical protein
MGERIHQKLNRVRKPCVQPIWSRAITLTTRCCTLSQWPSDATTADVVVRLRDDV